jgi:hypothetical protein
MLYFCKCISIRIYKDISEQSGPVTPVSPQFFHSVGGWYKRPIGRCLLLVESINRGIWEGEL